MIALIRLFRRCEASILAHRPQARAIHCGLYASRKRKFARKAKLRVAIEAAQIFFAEKIGYSNIRTGDKCLLSLFRFLSGLARSRLTPLLRVFALVWLHKLPLSNAPMHYNMIDEQVASSHMIECERQVFARKTRAGLVPLWC